MHDGESQRIRMTAATRLTNPEIQAKVAVEIARFGSSFGGPEREMAFDLAMKTVQDPHELVLRLTKTFT